MVQKRTWADEVCNISVLVVFGVGTDGYRTVLGLAEGAKEDKAGWLAFLKYLKERGLIGAQLFISDACFGLIDAIGSVTPRRAGSAVPSMSFASCLTATCARRHRY